MDTGFFRQALQEIGNGRRFDQLTPAEQSAVMQRAQELKAAEPGLLSDRRKYERMYYPTSV